MLRYDAEKARCWRGAHPLMGELHSLNLIWVCQSRSCEMSNGCEGRKKDRIAIIKSDLRAGSEIAEIAQEPVSWNYIEYTMQAGQCSTAINNLMPAFGGRELLFRYQLPRLSVYMAATEPCVTSTIKLAGQQTTNRIAIEYVLLQSIYECTKPNPSNRSRAPTPYSMRVFMTNINDDQQRKRSLNSL